MWPIIARYGNLAQTFASKVPSFFGLTQGPERDRRYKTDPVPEPERADWTREKIKTSARFPAFLPYFDESQVLYETQEMRRQFRRMLADPNVKSALLGKIVPVTALELKFHAAGDHPRYKEHAEFLDWSIKRRLKGGLMALAWNVLVHGCIDGYSINEKVWTFQDGQRYHGKRVLSDLKAKDPDQDCVLWFDEYKNVTGVMGLKWNAGEVWNPKEFLIYSHQPLYNNATGISDFRSVYGRYWMLDSVTKMRGRGAEKRAEPIVWGEYPDGTKQNSVQNMLARVKSQNWGAVPAGVKLQVLDTAGSSSDYFEKFTSSLREEIFLGIAGAILQNLTGGEGELRGNSKVHQNTAAAFKWALTQSVVQCFNDYDNGLIRDILTGAGNYRDVFDYPYATMTGVDDAELAESMAIDQGLKSLGYVESQEGLEERYGRKLEKAPEQSGGLTGTSGALDSIIGGDTAQPDGDDPDADEVQSDEFSEGSYGHSHPSRNEGRGRSGSGGKRDLLRSAQDAANPRRSGVSGEAPNDSGSMVDLARPKRSASVRELFAEHDVSGEARDESGQWTAGSGAPTGKKSAAQGGLKNRFAKRTPQQTYGLFQGSQVDWANLPEHEKQSAIENLAKLPAKKLRRDHEDWSDIWDERERLAKHGVSGPETAYYQRFVQPDIDDAKARVDVLERALAHGHGIEPDTDPMSVPGAWRKIKKHGESFSADQTVNALTRQPRKFGGDVKALPQDLPKMPFDHVLWGLCKRLSPTERPAQVPFVCGNIGAATLKLVDFDAAKLKDMETVEGANGHENPDLVPANECWADCNLDPHEWPFIFLHEVSEWRDMGNGMGYEEAHARANSLEYQARSIAEGDAAEFAEEYHGPQAPGPGWTLAGQGPRGGKVWRKTGKPGKAAPQKPQPKAKSPAPQATSHQSSVKIKPTKTRAFTGQPVAVKNQISKQAAGKIGEAVVLAWLHAQGLKDARHMNLERNNFPIDLVQDHAVIEVKTGNVANSVKAQQWRLTIGEPGKAEKEMLAKMPDEEKAAWNAKKQDMIHERKARALADLSKKLGKPVKSKTITCLINPDTKTVDIYEFEGWHDRIGWNSPEAKKSYKGSVSYG